MTGPERRVAGARERARAEIRAEILATANRHVAAYGAATLSLRAIARDLGMVSSALYRYFAGRDELLTALIIEAYDSLGEHVERAVEQSRGRHALDRWIDAAATIRAWAVDRPHEYALLYGSPVPGYAAPTDTVDPGTRVTRALIDVVRDAALHDGIEFAGGRPRREVGRQTHLAFEALRVEIDLDAGDDVVLGLIAAWTQLFGLLSFELFGQTKGIVDDHESLFVECAALMGRCIGL